MLNRMGGSDSFFCKINSVNINRWLTTENMFSKHCGLVAISLASLRYRSYEPLPTSLHDANHSGKIKRNRIIWDESRLRLRKVETIC